ncbi:MAG: hypothetical protein A2W72_02445 [Burkholderiales bacterium RIFCSPLOWO2_12_67_14]|nr:MAG: hypothetical protein A3I64_20255 [Burkholderiales bacterium RIFCSPLOWO2_02_FULL_67_64]OGB35847.1 MAG: hypothetical protein A3E51_06310 [Burkholderiales bacterium RIFCSPHIGHO2_12_FULL_67_38]OGB38523.1 MAG: hypothetical protein A2W72_02445 [Burkholderiales bacterium RIFCSPLOWO2_12_67_14]OGB76143.1 MAG: hypothetical protein A3G82_19730 [Burkholderiales bacterium RIFCSPLOWO2_12_FULL_67_210]
MSLSDTVSSVLRNAIAHLADAAIPVFTFALYFDHESSAVSVCADTEESSNRLVSNMNSYNTKHFHNAVSSADLEMAALWQANIGRSLSLGDFAVVDLCRSELPDVTQNDSLFLTMVRCLVAVEKDVLSLTTRPERLLFACSGKDKEVAYVWSASGDA